MKIMPDSIKVVFFDIDYTLYIKNEARIPTSIIKEVLPRLKAKEIIPAIATGRNVGGFPKALLPYLNEEGFQLLVTINGQDNLYRDQQISAYGLSTERIMQAVEKRESITKYAEVVPFSQIEENDFNLNIPRYVDTFEAEEEIDLVKISEKLAALSLESEQTDKVIAEYCTELGIVSPFVRGK